MCCSSWGCKESDTTELLNLPSEGACVYARSLQLCPTLCDPKDYSPPFSALENGICYVVYLLKYS